MMAISLFSLFGTAQTERPIPREPAGRAVVPGLPADTRVQRDIAYVEGGSKAQRLDLYLPAKADKPRPLIIWIHGGGWSGGDKASCPAARYVADGYAVASLNYRLSGEAVFPAQIQDCKAAVRWLRANAAKNGIDPEKFAVWGSSAGGHLVALLGTAGASTHFAQVGGNAGVSEAVQAVCDLFGPTDLLLMDKHAAGKGAFRHDDPGSPEARLIGGPIQENKDKAERVSPLRYLTKDCPPFLILHGIHDRTVPIGQSELLAERLKANGTPVTFQKIVGGHGGPGFNQPDADGLIRAFFAKTLKGQDVALKTFAIDENAPEPAAPNRRPR